MSRARCWVLIIMPFGMLFFSVSGSWHQAMRKATCSPPSICQLATFLPQELARLHIPGVEVSVVSHNQVIYAHGFGNADVFGRHMTADTPIVLGSVTKSFTALAILQLVQGGKLALDESVQHYLPWFHTADAAESAHITVRDLLNQTSGLGTFASLGTDAQPDRTLEEQVVSLALAPLRTAPSTHFEYANSNYQILGLLVRVASHESYGAYIQDHIFAPLHMTNSFSSPAVASHSGLAQSFNWWFGIPGPIPTPFSQANLPAGYLISTADDLAHYLLAQLNGGVYKGNSVLSSTGIALMHTPGPTFGGAGASRGYGMGWFVAPMGDVPGIWHGGEVSGANTLLMLQPDQHWGLALLCNINSLVLNGLPNDPLAQLRRDVVQVVAGKTPASEGGLSAEELYLICDLLLLTTVCLVVLPLVCLPKWGRRFIQLRSKEQFGVFRRFMLVVRIGWELLLPGIGLLAASWGLHLPWITVIRMLMLDMPDFGSAFLLLSVLVMVTGVRRMALIAYALGLRWPGKGGTKPFSHNGIHPW